MHPSALYRPAAPSPTPVATLALAALLWLAGCSATAPTARDTAQTPPLRTQQTSIRLLRRIPCVTSVTHWTCPDYLATPENTGLEINSFHYRIFTTLQDPLILRQTPVLLESAYQAYSNFINTPLPSHDKLLVYLFDNRHQWEAFTLRWMPRQAPLYLKIRSGAYYANHACVAYHISRQADFAVLAHEAWHQFADQLFACHLPAWLDEAMATNFESHQWRNGRVQFQPRYNTGRLIALRTAMASGKMLPLTQLLTLDPGQVVAHGPTPPNPDQPLDTLTAAYYAQLYALARFFRESGHGRHLHAFKTLLTDAALGQWPLPQELRHEGLQHDRKPSRRWNAKVGPFIVANYLLADTAQLQMAYHAFCHKILAQTSLKKTF